MRQLERGFHPGVLVLDPVKHGISVHKGHFGLNRRIERPVHGDKEVPANELVELHVMHMSSLTQVGGMEHREYVIVVDVELGDVVALDAFAYGEPVKAENFR